MAYTKQTWANGDIITAQRLNHMEDGIADAFSPFIVYITSDDGTYVTSKTFAEVKQASLQGKPIIYIFIFEGSTTMSLVTYCSDNDCTIIMAEDINMDNYNAVYGYRLIHDADGIRDVENAEPEA